MKTVIIILGASILAGVVFIFWNDIISPATPGPQVLGPADEVYEKITKHIESLDNASFQFSRFYEIKSEINQHEGNNNLSKEQSESLVKNLVTVVAPGLTKEVEGYFLNNKEDEAYLYKLHKSIQEIRDKYNTDLLDKPLNLTNAYYRYKKAAGEIEQLKQYEFNKDDKIRIKNVFENIASTQTIFRNNTHFNASRSKTKNQWEDFETLHIIFENGITNRNLSCNDFDGYQYYLEQCRRLSNEFEDF